MQNISDSDVRRKNQRTDQKDVLISSGIEQYACSVETYTEMASAFLFLHQDNDDRRLFDSEYHQIQSFYFHYPGERVEYALRYKGLALVEADGTWIPFEGLSDGYRDQLSLLQRLNDKRRVAGTNKLHFGKKFRECIDR